MAVNVHARERARSLQSYSTRRVCECVFCVCVYACTHGALHRDTCVREETRVRFARARRASFRLESSSSPSRVGVLRSAIRVCACPSAVYLHCSITVIRDGINRYRRLSIFHGDSPRRGKRRVSCLLFRSLLSFSRARETRRHVSPAYRRPSAVTFRKVNLAVAFSTAE